jgi:hypothetical protein
MKLTPHRTGPPERTDKRSMVATLLFGLIFLGFVEESPLETDVVLYHGLWRSVFVVFAPLFTSLPGISISPWQILLFVLVPFCLRTSGTIQQRSREMHRAIFVSVVCIAVTFLWGLARGGSAYFAYYQVWHFMAALLIAYLLMSAMRTERDLVSLGKIVVLAALIRATLCIYFFWTYLYGKPLPLGDYVTNHDDSMLWVVATLILLIWAVLKGGRGTWTIAGLGVPSMLYAMVLNNRRIAWVELLLAALLTYFLMGAGPLRSRINRWAIRASPVALIYIVAGLGSDSAVFAPVHALMTTGSNYDASSLTRLEEDRNLLHTLFDIGNPILGTGWGRPYDKLESYYSNYAPGWILYLYTPHNSLLGLAVFSGLVGVIGIWGVVTMGAYLAARGYRASTDLVPRAAGLAALCSLAAYSAHCYGDIGLQSFAGALIFGAALATAGKVAAWGEALPSAHTAPTQAEDGHPQPVPRFAYRNGMTPQRHYEPSSPKPGPSAGNDVTRKPGRAPMRRPSR